MNPLARVLGLVFPACGAAGPAGLPVPPRIDFARLVRPESPNTALAAPAGYQPAPDLVTPVYRLPPDRLAAAIRAVAAAQPRTWLTAEFPAQGQLHFVARSRWGNFPDRVTAQVDPEGSAGATLVLYSRSVYGYADFGANRARIVAWLAELDRTLAARNKRSCLDA